MHKPGDKVVAYSDYWHERPYGPGEVVRAEKGNDHRVYYTVRLDTPVEMTTPPRMEREVLTPCVLGEEEALAQAHKVRERWGRIIYPLTKEDCK